jgi:hypothetical protein
MFTFFPMLHNPNSPLSDVLYASQPSTLPTACPYQKDKRAEVVTLHSGKLSVSPLNKSTVHDFFLI